MMRPPHRVMGCWLALGAVVVIVGIGARPRTGFAQPEPRAEGRQVLSAQDLERIERRVAQIIETHRKIREGLTEIKDEVKIVKIRVSR